MVEVLHIPCFSLSLVVSACLVLTIGPLGCAGGPDESYSRACGLMAVASSRGGPDAAGKYREAYEILMKIKEENPGWETANVERLIEKCEQRVQSTPSGEEELAPDELLAHAKQLAAEEVSLREREGHSAVQDGGAQKEYLSPPRITFRKAREGRSRSYSGVAVEHYERAGEMVARNDYNGAIAELREAIYLEGDYIEAFLALGEIYEAAGQDEIAMEAYRSALDIDNNATGAHCGIGNLLLRGGMRLERENKLMEAWAEYQNAVLEFKRAAWVDIDYGAAYYGIGVAYSRLGRHSDAAYYWRKTIETEGEGSELGERAADNLSVVGLGL